MAGAGYKLFNTGDVLTAAQVNTYLQEQTVMVFANSTARTTALSGVLAEGMVSYLQDTNAVEVYNGSAWVGVSGAGDVTEVQAGTGISVASGTGPIPVVTNTMATAVDAKGDLIVGTGADTFARLAVGTNGYTLVADSSVSPTGLKWAAPAGGGKVLQVVSVVKDDTFSLTSQTFTDVTGLSVSITPSANTSKILVLHQLSTGADPSQTIFQARLLRDSTVINAGATASNRTLGFMSFASSAALQMVQSGAFLDSPATTSSLTYKIQVRAAHSGATVYVNRSAGDEDNGERSRQASTITVLEIGA